MIVYIKDKKYLEVFADIYNSANLIFEETQRASASADIFETQLDRDENFLELLDNGEAAAFMSYHIFGKYSELTSLYVRKEYQKEGIGRNLLRYFEKNLNTGDIVFVKVLNNALWAESFYKKNGYLQIDDKLREISASIGIVEKPWSKVLYKRI